MGKLNNNQQGFSAVEGLIVLVVLVVVGGAGYLVYKNQNKTTKTTTPKTTQTTTSTSQTTDATSKWYLYKSSDNTFQMKLADGLTFVGSNDKTGIYTNDPIVLGTTTAKVVTENKANEATSGLYVNYFSTSTAAEVRGEKQPGFKTTSGLDVAKYYYTQTTEPQGSGLQKGGKEYTYLITKGGKSLVITYDVSPTQTANTDLVEQMVKTAVLN